MKKPIKKFSLALPIFMAAGGLIALIIKPELPAKVTAATGSELASTPKDLSLRSWKRALIEAKNAVNDKQIPILAAGIAYFSTLAFFPLAAAVVAIASLVIEPWQIEQIAGSISNYLPKDISSLFITQLQNASGNHAGNIFAIIIGIGVSLFGVSGAVQNLMSALNIAYETDETRGFIKLKLTSFGLTILTILAGMIILPALFTGESFLRSVGVAAPVISVFSVVRWVILAVVASLGLAVVYRVAPDRNPGPKWQWVSWGAIIATLGWMIISAGFFIYLQKFANFSSSYSIFAGIIALMMWLNLSSMIILVGALVNHRLEKQTILPTHS